jgi:tRNA(His) guanylyltransferase
MKFDDLDKMMRVYETSLDQYVMPGVYMVARIDGRSFTKLTKNTLKLERPFDVRFRNAMIATVEHLMNSGFKIIYGYTESDEISLLFDLNEKSFDRKVRKLNSILAGEASAIFTYQMDTIAAFDCRICPLPDAGKVIDYFRWRAEDALRNSLSAYCYWKLRDTGKSQSQATKDVSGLSVAGKNELLFSMGINFNDLPAWQKRGVGFYYEQFEKEAFNPKMNEKVIAMKKRLKCDLELPVGEKYSTLINNIINSN